MRISREVWKFTILFGALFGGGALAWSYLGLATLQADTYRSAAQGTQDSARQLAAHVGNWFKVFERDVQFRFSAYPDNLRDAERRRGEAGEKHLREYLERQVRKLAKDYPELVTITAFRDEKLVGRFILDENQTDAANLALADLKHPFDFEPIRREGPSVTFGRIDTRQATARVLITIDKKYALGFDLGIGFFKRVLPDSQQTVHFVTDAHGRLLFRTSGSRFGEGEDLSHLPVVQRALEENVDAAPVVYRELPGEPYQIGAFHPVGYARAQAFAQSPDPRGEQGFLDFIGLAARAHPWMTLLIVLLPIAIFWSMLASRLVSVTNAENVASVTRDEHDQHAA
ncbi:MAG: hypothetical protein AB7P04_00750 [Bacteriovoracia bacterium]